MELIIATLENQNTFDIENSKVKRLEFRNRQLEEENKLLLAMLAEALAGRTVVIREEALQRRPRFKIEENMGGDIIISCR